MESRKQILENEFDIPMTKQIDEEVLDMCNLGMAVQLRGVEMGRAEGRAESTLLCIKNLMKNMKLTAQKAMDALKIPDEERTHYMEMLK